MTLSYLHSLAKEKFQTQTEEMNSNFHENSNKAEMGEKRTQNLPDNKPDTAFARHDQEGKLEHHSWVVRVGDKSSLNRYKK